MAYFKIDSEARAEEISRKMWEIMSPTDTTCTHLFGWGSDSNAQDYIIIELDMVCPVYVHENFHTVLNDVGTLLGIEQEEGAQLRQYLETGQVVLGNLIPSTLEQFEPYFAPTPIVFTP